MHEVKTTDTNARPVDTGAFRTFSVADQADRVDMPAPLVARRKKVSCGKCKTCTCLGSKVLAFGLAD